MNESVLPRGDHSPPCARAGTALHESPGKPAAAALRRRPRHQRGAAVARRRDLRRVAHRACGRPPSGSRPAPSLLGGFGLWWPGHFLAPLDAGSVLGIPFLAGGLAWGLAGLALITAVAATRKTVPAFAGLAVITLAGRLRAFGVRHAGPVPRDRRVRRVGPRHRGLLPGHAFWSGSASSSSRARSCAPPASAAPCSAPSC